MHKGTKEVRVDLGFMLSLWLFRFVLSVPYVA
jgi:hypothetical protein